MVKRRFSLVENASQMDELWLDVLGCSGSRFEKTLENPAAQSLGAAGVRAEFDREHE
jgi:hypothetical protein